MALQYILAKMGSHFASFLLVRSAQIPIIAKSHFCAKLAENLLSPTFPFLLHSNETNVRFLEPVFTVRMSFKNISRNPICLMEAVLLSFSLGKC